jgi:hypothetical protein
MKIYNNRQMSNSLYSNIMSRANGKDYSTFDHRDPERNLLLERIQQGSSTEQEDALNATRIAMVVSGCFIILAVVITLAIVFIL